MKKLFLFLCPLMILSACEKSDNPDNLVDDPTKPTQELTPDEQKVKLEKVADEALAIVPETDDVKTYFRLIDLFEDKYLNDTYDWDQLFEHIDDISSSFYQESFSVKGNKVSYIDEIFVLMSNVKGTIKLEQNHAVFLESDDTRLVFSLDGKSYVFEFTHSKKFTEVKYEFSYSYEGNGYYDPEDDRYYYDDVTKYYYTYVTIELPEQIKVQLLEDSEPLFVIQADCKVNISEPINLYKDNVSVNLTIKFEDSEFKLANTSFDASTGKLSSSFSLTIDGTYFLACDLSAKAQILEEADPDGNTYPYIGSIDDIAFALDILNEIQLRGTCSDFMLLYDYVMMLDESDSLTEAERLVKNMNSLVDLGLYYDGGSNRQVKLEFELVEDDYGYYCDLVLVFNDGSRNLFFDYFSDSFFTSLMEEIEDMIYEYEDLIESELS